ncbi:MAG TPA: cupin domain-containing protein [Solirubrobacteraceae bacterium]|nr:cupin domain-containing protein [Solirubrobacteraceae bacterium]
MSTTYTIKNLRAVADSAPQFGLSDVQEAHFAHDELEASDTGLSFLVLKPDRRQSFGHRHEQAEEVYVVLEGSGRVKLDDDVVDIGPLDAVRVSPAVVRAFEAGPEGLQLLAFGPRRKGDGELLPGWW